MQRIEMSSSMSMCKGSIPPELRKKLQENEENEKLENTKKNISKDNKKSEK